MERTHSEGHAVQRVGWLRAAILGANDGLISTASLIVGVAAASAPQHQVIVAGVAALVAGAMSMAAGEFVSVSSQLDTENADLARERKELAADPEAELRELTRIYVGRGLEPKLADEVARQLTANDALEAHARDELGISEALRARPVQASLASAASFTAGALPPLLLVLICPAPALTAAVAIGTLIFLALLGAVGARLGGAKILRATVRVTVWGALALAVTAGIGAAFGTVV
jgi:VIT1/CCC1 family predicted Fe2+/Mn2+ transporter